MKYGKRPPTPHCVFDGALNCLCIYCVYCAVVVLETTVPDGSVTSVVSTTRIPIIVQPKRGKCTGGISTLLIINMHAVRGRGIAD